MHRDARSTALTTARTPAGLVVPILLAGVLVVAVTGGRMVACQA